MLDQISDIVTHTTLLMVSEGRTVLLPTDVLPWGYLRTPQGGGPHTSLLMVSEGRTVYLQTDVFPGGYL